MTRSDGAPQFGLLPAGTAFERKWIAYEERAAAEERDVVETLRGGRGEQAASASERRDGRIVMAKRDVYEVERKIAGSFAQRRPERATLMLLDAGFVASRCL